MASTKETAPTIRRLIIHHLSDLHYEKDQNGAQKKDILVEYSGFLAKLPRDRKPDLIIVTGDLTASGKVVDADMVVGNLKVAFPEWTGRFDKHIYVVPGPNDVNWEGDTDPGLKQFYDSFKDFALPREGAPVDRPAPGIIVSDAPAANEASFVVYPLDTCYSPDDLQAELKREFTEYATKYEDFVKQRGALSKRRSGLRAWLESIRKEKGEQARKELLEKLRKAFLGLTEGAPPVALDSGRVTQQDIESFKSWIEELKRKQAASNAPKDPLKILITHHALAIEAEQSNETNASEVAMRSFQQISKEARTAGFHLALHGHIHKPQVLSDLSILEGIDTQPPMRQIGAASFGETGLFNEITAQYREEADGQGIWRLEMRLANVRATEVSKSSFVLLNPAESADTVVEEMERARAVRESFDQRMRTAMRSFADQVFLTQNEVRAEKIKTDLLPEAMRPFEGMIRDTIFDGFATRVRLILKNIEPYDRAPTLTEKYLTFAETDDTDSLLYPASISAWSLVLGRTLCYPDVMDMSTTALDHQWLLRCNKIPDLLKALSWQMKDAAERSSPRIEKKNRLETIYYSLKTIQENGETAISGADIYQEPLAGGVQSEYPYFVCVPYPMRPRTAVANQLPEIAALEVSVREMKPLYGAQSPLGKEPKDKVNPFTPERIEMLECLMDLIGLILTTTNALGKPEGKWDERSKA